MQLGVGEDFQTAWADDEYVMRRDWLNIRPKFVKMNGGLHDLSEAVNNLKNNMEDRFSMVR